MEQTLPQNQSQYTTISGNKQKQLYIKFQVFNTQQLLKIVKQLYNIQSIQIKEIGDGWQTKSYKISTKDSNFVLKIQRTTFDLNDIITFQHYQLHDKALLHIQKQIKLQQSQLGKKSVYEFTKLIPNKFNKYTSKQILIGKQYMVRMMNYIQGQLCILQNQSIPKSIGQIAGKMDNYLYTLQVPEEKALFKDGSKDKIQDYISFASQRQKIIYACQNLYKQARKYIPNYEQDTKNKVKLINKAFDGYERIFLKNLQNLRTMIVHDDLHQQNMLMKFCQTENCLKVFGVLDFGWNLHHNFIITELAFVIAVYVIRNNTWKQKGQYNKLNILQICKDILKGYLKHFKLQNIEIQCLFYASLYKLGNRFSDRKWDYYGYQLVEGIIQLDCQIFTRQIKKILID